MFGEFAKYIFKFMGLTTFEKFMTWVVKFLVLVFIMLLWNSYSYLPRLHMKAVLLVYLVYLLVRSFPTMAETGKRLVARAAGGVRFNHVVLIFIVFAALCVGAWLRNNYAWYHVPDGAKVALLACVGFWLLTSIPPLRQLGNLIILFVVFPYVLFLTWEAVLPMFWRHRPEMELVHVWLGWVSLNAVSVFLSRLVRLKEIL